MKKFIICLLTILLCTTLTGCKLTDDISKWMDERSADSDRESLFDSIRDDTANTPLSEDTLSAASDALKAQGALDEARNKHDGWDIIPFVHSWRVGKAEGKLMNAQSAYEAAYSTDSVRLAYEADQREARDKQDKKSGNNNLILILIALLVIGLVVFLLMRKPKKAVATAPAPAPVQRAPAQITEHKQLGAVKADKMVACRKLASKYNLDADKELVKYNGDVDKLYSSLIMMTPLDE